MLVLSRKKMERIIIGEGADAIVVTLVDIRGDKARIAIEAPKRMPVHRDEVYEEIHGEGSVTALAWNIQRNGGDDHEHDEDRTCIRTGNRITGQPGRRARDHAGGDEAAEPV